MACGCKTNLNLTIDKAKQLSIKMHQDIQVYSYVENEITYYGYEYINPARENILEIIKHDAI